LNYDARNHELKNKCNALFFVDTNTNTLTHKTHVRDAEAERFATPTFDRRSVRKENGQNATDLGHILYVKGVLEATPYISTLLRENPQSVK